MSFGEFETPKIRINEKILKESFAVHEKTLRNVFASAKKSHNTLRELQDILQNENSNTKK